MAEYTNLLLQELHLRSHEIPHKNISSIYFGGGTPSLLPAQDILTLREGIANVGFQIDPQAEITIEINPGTITDEKLDLYLAAGVNRYSVGVQTFNDAYLAQCGREHSANESRRTLQFLTDNKLNYSFDLLFGLPHQGLQELKNDLEELVSYNPPHVSLYNLTVPESHSMNFGRAPDEVQAEMFDLIEQHLLRVGIRRYELSNFAKPGYESAHNSLYWTDQPYWGIGVSAHSYLPKMSTWGTRFWNPTSASSYKEQIESKTTIKKIPTRQLEDLKLHEALTDYCHTSLRRLSGLSFAAFDQKFGVQLRHQLEKKAESLTKEGLLQATRDGLSLTKQGLPLANKVFLGLTFSDTDFSGSAR